ncbi:Voltage-dependent T-type calcium channel subunit alpha-1I [Bagarius yarrelli]|uniref:Voltage-dependent T-type calcium channel subunit alpha-1I n=1 Tax=Bagarius yarrelli TaxID=175774 RepID=A0A556TTI1_BAGYA|nr:Voltage-dependent T-type calcium channel subunit alpha-1I [Bagarius yarrelli]
MTLPAAYYSPDEEDERPFICSLPQDNGIMSCSDVPARREGGRECCLDVEDALHLQTLGLAADPLLNASMGVVPGLCVNWNRYYTQCRTGFSNPHKGAINFDNIGYAWIVIFQVITLEGWVEIMYYVMDAHSFYNFIYFILLIIVGSFFMINLCLVVIATQFSETKQREHQLMQEQRARCLSSSTLAEPGDCYEELFQLTCHVLRKARRRTAAFFRALRPHPRQATPTQSQSNVNGGERGQRQHQGSHCPHHTKPESALPECSDVLTSPPVSEDCPHCMVLSLRDGAGPTVMSAKEETEESELEDKDGQSGQSVEQKEKRMCQGKCKELWMGMRIKLWGIPEELTNVLEICNIVFTSMFALEMILKLTAFGCFNYLRNPYNIFDGIIVIISVCEIVGQSDGGLSVLRTFRLLRVLKLVRFMPALRRQLVVLMKTMDNVATFCMLLMLFIFIFSILGMHIFGCKFSLKTDAGDTVPDRKNFDSLLWAIVTVFQGDANRSYSEDDGSSSNFDGSDRYKDSLQLSDPKICALTPNGHLEMTPIGGGKINLDEESRKSSATSLGKSSLEQRSFSLRHGRSSLYRHWGRPQPQSAWSRRSSWNSVGRATRGLKVGGSLRVRGPHSHPAERESLLSPRPQISHYPALLSRRCPLRRDRRALSLELPEQFQLPMPPLQHPLLIQKKSVCGEQHQDCNGKAPMRQRALLSEVYPQLNARKDKPHLDEETDYSLCFRIQKMIEVYRPDWCETREDWSVYLFSPENKFRLTCQKIIAHKLFDYIVLAFIFLNCITVALERPKIHQGSLERVFLTISNYIFTAIFVAEMTVKVVSMGLYLGDRAYLRSSWNILDGFLVFVSLIDIVVSMAGGAKILGVLRVLRLLRTLRPLRVISRAPGLKLVVETLITSLKPIGNIVLICCAFFIIFGILGVQACLCVFCLLASKDGWVNIMYHGSPVTNNNPWMLLYFISFLLIVSFFVLNMFVGVVVENFHKCRQHQEVEEAKRREEKRLRRMEKKRRKAQKLPYYAGYGHVRLMIHSLCTSHYLDLFITLIICINVVTMSLEHYDQPKSLETALKYCNYFFSSTFVLEATLKLIAFGFRRFFKDRWNQLDLAIVLLSVMGITLEEIEINASLPINPTIIRIMRVLRIARVLKLLKMATGMRALLDTVVQALPQVGNLGLLFMLLFFIYAALGVELFGELVCNADYPCEGMSRHATFENFGMAFLTLFQVSTGDNWNGIMKDTLRECPPGDTYSCNGSLQFISPMYFVSFVLTAQFVLINVVVAVLMKHLDDSNKEAQEEAEMDAEIELELAQGGLCCLGGLAAAAGPGIGVGTGVGGGGGGSGCGGEERPGLECGSRQAAMVGAHVHASQSGYTPPSGGHESHNHRKLYSPAQENLWLDSVSLLIKDSLEGEMQMIDNLSGSVFHHYSSPAVCKGCRCQPTEEERGCSTSQSLEELQAKPMESHSKSRAFSMGCEGGDRLPNPDLQNQEDAACLQHVPFFKRADGERGGNSSRRDRRMPSSLFHLPAEFFHPATAVPQGSFVSGIERPGRTGSRLTSPASWASLRSPGANSRVMGSQPPSHSESSLATGNSEVSPQTMLGEGINFNMPPNRDLSLPQPLLCPVPDQNHSSLNLNQRLHPDQTSFTLQATRGHQRSQSNCDSSPNHSCNRMDSIEPSDEDTGIGRGSSQAFNSEHLSETTSSLSLSSLFTPGSLAPTLAKKCNSTGSLEQGNTLARNKNGRHLQSTEQHELLLNLWTGERDGGDGEKEVTGLGVKSSSQTMDAGSRKNR